MVSVKRSSYSAFEKDSFLCDSGKLPGEGNRHKIEKFEYDKSDRVISIRRNYHDLPGYDI